MKRLALALLAATAAAQTPSPSDPPASASPTAVPARNEDDALRRVHLRKASLERELARLRGQEKSLLGEVDRLELGAWVRASAMTGPYPYVDWHR